MEFQMMHESKTVKDASISGDVDEISRQLSALRDDMARLAETVKAIAGRRGGNMAADIAEGFDEARRYAGTTGRSAEARFEGSVATHPLMAVGLAAGAGFLVGALSRR
jgi:ElaB/YqjD/DUF883 family membrane-anchored ribosome-binding protein